MELNYPWVVAVPVLMIVDGLAAWGCFTWRSAGYDAHFKEEFRDLNPLWRKAAEVPRRYLLRYWTLAVVLSILFVFVTQGTTPGDRVVTGAVAGIVTVLAMRTGQRVASLIVYIKVARHPDCVHGEVVLTRGLQMTNSAATKGVIVLPLAALAMMAPSPETIGALVAALLLLGVNVLWLLRERARK